MRGFGAVLGSETGLSGGIESSFNVKANPYKEQTFQGVPFRPFEFQFMFRARNAEEVEAAKDKPYKQPNYKLLQQYFFFYKQNCF